MHLTIYFTISVILVVLLIFDLTTNNKREKNLFFFLGTIFVVGLLAFRGTYIGGDTPAYCGYFSGKGGWYGTLEDNDTFEIGFRLFCHALSKVSRSEFWFLFVTSLITMVPFIYLIKRDTQGSKILPLCQYMLLWGILSITQTAIRQNLSVACLMIAYILWTTPIKKLRNKYISTLLFIICGLMLHNSGTIALILYFICNSISLTKKKALLLIFCSFIISLCLNDFFYNIFNLIYIVIGQFEATQIFFDRYYLNGYDFSDEVSFNRLFPLTVFVSLMTLISNKQELCSIYCKMLIIGSCLFILGMSFPMMFRSVYPIMFMGIVFCPISIRIPQYSKMKIGVIFIFIFFCYQKLKIEYGTSSQMAPYTFIWEKNDMRTLKNNSLQFK